MNKSDPNDVIDAFKQETASSLADWQAVDAALAREPIALRRKVAADSFMTLAVGWESFLSDWWVSAVNRDASQIVNRLSARLAQFASIELRVPTGHVASPSITKSHLRVDEVRTLLDPNHFNVVIHGRKELADRAALDLADPYKSQATAITGYQWCPAELTRRIRNVLAHRSPSAIDSANAMVAAGSTPPALRWTNAQRLNVRGFGRYLLSLGDTPPRVQRFHTALADLAERFRVP